VKRGLCIAAGCLLLGAVINVAVAWACAVWIDGGRPFIASAVEGVTAREHPRWQVALGRRAGATVIRSTASGIPRPPVLLPADATQEETRAWLGGAGGSLGRPDVVEVPGWSRAAVPPDESDYQGRAVWEDARGWPMVCLVSYSLDFGGRPEAPWALDLGGTQGPAGLRRVLPLRPLAVGVAANTVFYAVVLWSAVLGPSAVRRFIRRRRHLCPACGYPIGESRLCTECGRKVRG
jgi:hypothetical protein